MTTPESSNLGISPSAAPTPAISSSLPNYIRTRDLHLFRKVVSPAWGTYYREEKEDPSGAIDIPPLKLADDFPRIPAHLMTAWIKLAQHFCYLTENETHNASTGSYEVQCLLLRKQPDYKEWRIIVPTQIVSATAVDSETEHWIDLVTGEEGAGFPPQGWVYAGSFHSHNRMNAFWSGRDDHFELGSPGLHATVGKLDGSKGYEICSSIVLAYKRNVIDAEKLIDLTWHEEVDFHPKVLQYVQFTKYVQKEVIASQSSNAAVWLRQDFERQNEREYIDTRDNKRKKRSMLSPRQKADFGFTKFGEEKKVPVDLGAGIAATRSVNSVEVEDLSEAITLIRDGLKKGVLDENESDEFFDIALGIHRAYSSLEKVDLLYEILETVLDTEDFLASTVEPTENDSEDLSDPFYYS